MVLRIPQTSTEVDKLLQAGTHMFHEISQQNENLMIEDLQPQWKIVTV